MTAPVTPADAAVTAAALIAASQGTDPVAYTVAGVSLATAATIASITTRTKAVLQRLWLPVDPYQDRQVAAFVKQADPILVAAQKATAQTAAAAQTTMLRSMGVNAAVVPKLPDDIRVPHAKRVVITYSESDTEPNIDVTVTPSDATNASLLERPARTLRWSESVGTSSDRARAASVIRLDDIVDGNLVIAQRDAEHQALNATIIDYQGQATTRSRTKTRTGARIIGFRRIIHPEFSTGGVCGLCVAASDRIYHRETLRPIHLRCVVPGTLVSGPPSQVGYRRYYEGELVTLVTAAGHQLSITPKHPVLTDRGWVQAGLLNIGDKLVSSVRADRSVVTGPDEDHVPARIEDVVRALGMEASATRLRMPVAAEEFHGDGFNSEVDVVAVDPFFGDEVNTALTQPLAEEYFTSAAATRASDGVLLDRLGAAPLLVPADGPSPRRSMGVGGLGFSLCRTHRRRLDQAGFSTGSDGQPALLQPTNDQRSRDAVMLGHRLDGLTFGVTTGKVGGHRNGLGTWVCPSRKFDPTVSDRDPERFAVFTKLGTDLRERLSSSVHLDTLIDKRVGVWRGHVLNLETVEGWYSANSITVSNCKCTSAPVTATYDPGLNLNDSDIKRLKTEAGSNSAADLKRTRYTVAYNELGPVLVPADGESVPYFTPMTEAA